MGYTFAASTVIIYDDADTTGGHAAGQPHSLLEMSLSTDPNVAASVISAGYNLPVYKIVNNIRAGSSTGGAANTTTWTETDVVMDCNSAKTILMGIGGGVSAPNVTFNWGTKIGSGNKATGRNGMVAYLGNTTTLSGNQNMYGCSIIQTAPAGGALTFSPTSGAGDIIDCIIGHRGTGAAAQIAFGTGPNPVRNAYNIDFWGNNTNANAGVLSSLNCANVERVTVGGNSFFYGLRSPQNVLSFKDLLVFGTPGTADMHVTGALTIAGGGNWSIVRPGWSGNAPKFGAITAEVGTIKEYWLYDVIVTNASGVAVSGIPVKLTDVLGNVQVNTTTDSGGRISFGSGITANAVSVMDHYGSASYLTRARSPFLAEINTGSGANMNYGPFRYYFNWPTETNGNFKDCTDVIPLQFASGSATPWVEMSI